MFFHFLISGFFIATLTWLYTLFTLKKFNRISFNSDDFDGAYLGSSLYLRGMVRKKGEDQMKEIQQFLDRY
jgi:hypothetical protein